MGYQIVFKTKINETEMSLRLSFIVPFYNVEPYIEECIRSLYAQDISWEEYEVICVDDCSPDGSRAIVERLQKEYPTLKLLTTPENLRQGGARNMGLDIAQGRMTISNLIAYKNSSHKPKRKAWIYWILILPAMPRYKPSARMTIHLIWGHVQAQTMLFAPTTADDGVGAVCVWGGD